mgnify:CR=1 FL=1
MEEIYIIYWSQTGNTQTMAEAIGKGVEKAGKTAQVLSVEDAALDVLKQAPCFALGCPAMGAEVLEEEEMEPFVSEVEKFAEGKTIALFGSYGWGDGEWMRNWEESCKEAGANLVCDSVICQEEPDDEATDACKALGAALV